MGFRNSITTDFIVDSPDYFVARTSNDELRFGLCGVSMYQVPLDHRVVEPLLMCKTSDDVEAVFDGYLSGAYDHGVQ